MGELISASEAAKRLGKSRTVVNRLIKAGILPAQMIGKQWVINADDLNRRELFDRPSGVRHDRKPKSP